MQQRLKYIIPFLLPVLFSCTSDVKKVSLAKDGLAGVVIITPSNASATIQFAGNELTRYLQKISGAKFTNQHDPYNGPAIKIELANGANKEDYSISVQDENILISGNSGRAILYAVYDFLSRLGCRWLAPDFSFYEGSAEIIPHTNELDYEASHDIAEQPGIAIRKLDVAGARTHNSHNLLKIIEWMPKARYNTLMIPMNLNNHGRVRWDAWSNRLTPELAKRDITVEVGQHGYQNFLNAEMENGTLFQKHPEWFGKDSTCSPTPSERLVFNTNDTGAVHYFINNIISYLKQHPEINVFALWPPDVGRWADCAEWRALGTPQDRQAQLSNMVDSAIKILNPRVRLEIIAYSHTLEPPRKVKLHDDILVDVCPINQSFEKQIYDTSSPNNAAYKAAIEAWRKNFKGDIGLYSYYRKYAWRSLPNVIPHYIQRDMQWYAGVPLQGISSYAEPGDWFTYELNHYILGYVAWNLRVNIDSLIHGFILSRYGKASNAAENAYTLLEQVVRTHGSTSFTTLKSAGEIQDALNKIEKNIALLRENETSSINTMTRKNLSRLLLMMEYAKRDLQIQYAIASRKPEDQVLSHIKSLLAFLEANISRGVFILTGENDLARFTKKYGLTHQSLLD